MALDRKFPDFKVENIGGFQMHGILMKKPVGHKSPTWSKRFFILKECCLLYYSETERKAFIEKGIFNIHPKGVIPLSCCRVEEVALPGVNYGISISFADGTNAISIGVETDDNRRVWIEALEVATKTTSENCALGDTLIRTLQEQTLALTSEKNKYFRKFLEEAEDAIYQRKQKEAAEEFNRELEKENQKLEGLIKKLLEDKEAKRSEMKETTDSREGLQQDDMDISRESDGIYQTIQTISSQRRGLSQKLENHDYERTFNESSQELHEQLEEIAKNSSKLEMEKNQLEQKLKENEEEISKYDQERSVISANTEELKLEIQGLKEEKKHFEEQMKQEVLAKIDLQRQLDECKATLKRFERERFCSNTSHSDGEEIDNPVQVPNDVNNLKKFFEGYPHNTLPSLSNFSHRPSRRCAHIKTRSKMDEREAAVTKEHQIPSVFETKKVEI